MSDIDFEMAARKFAKDQSSRRTKESEKKARLASERARMLAQKQRWEMEAEARQQEEARRRAEEERRHEEDLERNRGVVYHTRLTPLFSRAGEAKGIVRRADKLTLPPSANAALMEQQATRNGQLFFELSSGGGRRTHASILDFTAREGTVGLPHEVLRCLDLSHLSEDSSSLSQDVSPTVGAEAIAVRYRYLKKGTSAKVQPELSAFQADVSDIKSLLESELMLRTTLTQGDKIVVREGEESYVLRVVHVEPETAVSLIDTDLEVDLLPSVQAEEAAAAEEEAKRRIEEQSRLRAEKRREEEESKAAAAAAAAIAAAQDSAAALSRREQRRESALQQLSALAASHVTETAGSGAVSVAIRCPDGSRCTATFDPSDPLAALFLLVEAQWRETDVTNLLPEVFELASSFPRRVYSRVDGVSLAESGLASAQEALFVQIPSAA
ncbi:MAG: hypothetical protein SGPRY_003898 [Prymnesium sp.]